MRCYRKIPLSSYKDHVTKKRSSCQDPAGNPSHKTSDHKEMQTEVVRTCLPFITSSKNHTAKHSERGKKTRQMEEEVGKQHQGMDRRGVCQVPEGSGEQGRMEETGCEIICGAPWTLMYRSRWWWWWWWTPEFAPCCSIVPVHFLQWRDDFLSM